MDNETKIKLVVINENTLGYITPEQPYNYSTLHASILRGAIFELHPGPKLINKSDNIRLASEKDFEDYRYSFEGYSPEEYEFATAQ